MGWYEILSLIISILSLVATVAVSFVIYFLENRRETITQERERKKELQAKAKEFIQANDDEKEYLPLAQFASFLNPLYKHKRKIFNEFNKCDSDLQKEILKMLNFSDLKLEEYQKDNFVYKLLKLFEEKSKKINLYTNSFLYDGAKYFHRGFYDWGGMRINGNYERDKINNENPQNYFRKEYYQEWNGNYYRLDGHDIWLRLLDYVCFNQNKNKKEYFEESQRISGFSDKQVTIYSYILPKDFNEYIEMHKIKPLDYYWDLVTECEESECTYIVMEMVRNACLIINRMTKNNWTIPFEGNYTVERNEDLYYLTIQTLYATFKDEFIQNNRTDYENRVPKCT